MPQVRQPVQLHVAAVLQHVHHLSIALHVHYFRLSIRGQALVDDREQAIAFALLEGAEAVVAKHVLVSECVGVGDAHGAELVLCASGLVEGLGGAGGVVPAELLQTPVVGGVEDAMQGHRHEVLLAVWVPIKDLEEQAEVILQRLPLIESISAHAHFSLVFAPVYAFMGEVVVRRVPHRLHLLLTAIAQVPTRLLLERVLLSRTWREATERGSTLKNAWSYD